MPDANLRAGDAGPALLGDPVEIGRVPRFLMSEEASYVTGAEWVADGGNIPSHRF
uniref:hypothetical protein n=1 Tax=Burkholderia anthina TaxID=179879 RepID=UPI001FC7F12B|nr:hypothetical protein [Burkholderia anthina]